MTRIHNIVPGLQGNNVSKTGKIHKPQSLIFWPGNSLFSGVKIHKQTGIAGHLDHLNVHLENVSSGILGLMHHQGLPEFPYNISDKWATWLYRDMEWASNPTLWGNTKLEIAGIDKTCQTVSFNLTTEWPDSPIPTSDYIDQVWPAYFKTNPRYFQVLFPLFPFSWASAVGRVDVPIGNTSTNGLNPFDESVKNSEGLTLFNFEVKYYNADPSDVDDTTHLDRYFTAFNPYDDPEYFMDFFTLWSIVKRVYNKTPSN